MTVRELLWACSTARIRLEVTTAGKLRYNGPTEALDRLLPELREHRDELIEALSPHPDAPPTGWPYEQISVENRPGGEVVTTYRDGQGKLWIHTVWEHGSRWEAKPTPLAETPLSDMTDEQQQREVVSFRALNLEVELVHPDLGPFFLVPERTGQDRVELTPEDLVLLTTAKRAFPGSRWSELGSWAKN